MENIEAHIAQDKEILENPTTSPQQRRHIEHQLEQLERYVESTRKKSKQVIITIPPIWNCTVKITQNLTSVEFTKTNK